MTISQTNLRPLSVGEILDKAFRLYRANFLLLFGITATLLVPLGILNVASQLVFRNTTIVIYLQGFLSFLLNGALAWAVSRLYLGLPASIGEAYRVGSRRFGTMWGASIMQGLAYIPAIILVVVGTLLGKTPGLILVTLLIVPVILFLSTRWAIDIPCIIVEELRAGPSLGRSWVLTEKDFWHVLGTILTSGLLVYLVTLLPGVVIIFVSSQFTSLADLGPLLSALITQVGTLISTQLSISALVILYYDLRVRREGFDLQLAMQEPVPESAAPETTPFSDTGRN